MATIIGASFIMSNAPKVAKTPDDMGCDVMGCCYDTRVNGRVPTFIPRGLFRVSAAFFRVFSFLYRHEVRRRHREVLSRGIPTAAIDRIKSPATLGDVEGRAGS